MTKSYIRWDGFFTPTESGSYQIGLFGSTFRMYLDGKLLFEDMVAHPPGNTTKEVELEAGHRYPLRIEYVGGGAPAVRLIYSRGAADALPRAVAAAKNADAIIGVVGITSDLEGEEMKVDLPGFLGGRSDESRPAKAGRRPDGGDERHRQTGDRGC